MFVSIKIYLKYIVTINIKFKIHFLSILSGFVISISYRGRNSDGKLFLIKRDIQQTYGQNVPDPPSGCFGNWGYNSLGDVI